MNFASDTTAVAPSVLLLWFVPGIFWGFVLVPVRDVFARFVFGIGVSFALVPAAAVGMSAVTGNGIPPTIAIAAPSLVFVSGLVLFLFVKPAEPPKDDETVAGLGRAVKVVSISVVVAAVAVRSFVGVVLNDWPYIRGGDIYSHAVMANRMLSVGEIAPYLVYPPGFHTMTAITSRLSGVAPLEVFPFLAPSLLLLPALALYALGRVFGGWVCGVAAALFGGLVVNSTHLYFGDAMYPNMTSAEFLLPLAVAALILLYKTPSPRTIVLFAILGSSVVLYHPVGSLYAALLFACIGGFILPYLLLKDRRTGLALLASFAFLGVLAVVFAWDTYDLADVISGFIEDSGTGSGGEAVEMAVGSQAPLPLSHFTVTITLAVILLGLIGAALIVFGRSGLRIGGRLAGVTVLMWAVLLFAGSRTSLSGFPERFERDLAIPLALLAGFAVSEAISFIRERKGLSRSVTAILLAVVAVAVSVQVFWNYGAAFEPARNFVMTPGIREAGRWLEDHNEGGNIMVAPHENQVPSRAMLAMGGYSAYQSFTPTRIEYDRDLPPGGAGPMLDVLRVIYNPTNPRAQEIIEERDVRYVVFYKRFDPDTTWGDTQPTDVWTAFRGEPVSYETVFENESVVIFRPR